MTPEQNRIEQIRERLAAPDMQPRDYLATLTVHPFRYHTNDEPSYDATDVEGVVDGLLRRTLELELQLQQAQAEAAGLREEVGKVAGIAAVRGKQLYDALNCLVMMYNQYTPGPYGHDFMTAGEETQDLLGFHGLLRPDDTAIDLDGLNSEHEVPEAIKALQPHYGKGLE